MGLFDGIIRRQFAGATSSSAAKHVGMGARILPTACDSLSLEPPARFAV
jgi:hypothetical protein